MTPVRRPPSAVHRAWWLYLLACRGGRTYAGIALDVDARFKAHLGGKASKFTRANPPLKILGAQAFATRSEASKAEYVLKQLSRPAKLEWARRQGRSSFRKSIA
ncbi:MAG: GIY-YIG nuclease family protein [Steroidobacter sp.]